MNYILVGINHKTAPLKVREQLALDSESRYQVLSELLDSPLIKEATVISTCNRVEFYGSTDKPEQAQAHLLEKIAAPFQTIEEDFTRLFYIKQDQEVVTHLFHVASSLDSQIAGENQIAGQVKEAYQTAQKRSATGCHLNPLFDRALYVAKKVKSETDIGRGNISTGSIAILLAKKIFNSLIDKKVLLLGAGEISELAVRYLKAEQVNDVFIVNRTFERAQNLEKQGLGKACRYDELPERLQSADILITSILGTAGDLSHDFLKEIMPRRHHRPLFIIDLGVPRNVDDSVSNLTNLYLYNLDDLQEIAEENLKNRALSIEKAKNIIDHEARQFYEKHVSHQALPTIAGLGKKFELIRKKELDKTVSKMKHLRDEDRKNIERLTRSIVNKVLHDPILSLKNESEMREPGVLRVLKKLFRLDDEGEG